MGCDLRKITTCKVIGRFQSTHPHGVRPYVLYLCYKTYKVSIHAPAWGATDVRGSKVSIYKVSIHAPAWGATQSNSISTLYALFQSTHPHGVRRHTLTPPYQEDMFQSTHPHGVRQLAWKKYELEFMFQSTHPHGVRQILRGARGYPCSFNPRTRMGCDLPQ